MEKLTKHGDWNETKKKLKQKFIVLNESDLLFAKGRVNETLYRLQVKLGKTKEEIILLISKL